MILSFAILKGGTGKTTMNINIAAALATKNIRCLIVDCDPQINASVYLGIDEADISVLDILTNKAYIKDTIIAKSKYLHVIPGSYELSILNLDNKKFHYDILRDQLNILPKFSK